MSLYICRLANHTSNNTSRPCLIPHWQSYSQQARACVTVYSFTTVDGKLPGCQHETLLCTSLWSSMRHSHRYSRFSSRMANLQANCIELVSYWNIKIWLVTTHRCFFNGVVWNVQWKLFQSTPVMDGKAVHVQVIAYVVRWHIVT